MASARLYKKEDSDVIPMHDLKDGEMGIIVDEQRPKDIGKIVVRVYGKNVCQILGESDVYVYLEIKVRRLKPGELIEVQ